MIVTPRVDYLTNHECNPPPKLAMHGTHPTHTTFHAPLPGLSAASVEPGVQRRALHRPQDTALEGHGLAGAAADEDEGEERQRRMAVRIFCAVPSFLSTHSVPALPFTHALPSLAVAPCHSLRAAIPHSPLPPPSLLT